MSRQRLFVIAGLAAALGLCAGVAPLTAQNFGSAVAAGDGEVFVGEPLNQYASGAVYVYRPDGSGRWRLASTLTASDASANDHFGRALAWDQANLLIGATTVDSVRGAAYVFTRGSDGTWTQAAKLTATDGKPEDALGRAVALAGDLALVASWGRDSARGAVYVFHRAGSNWTQESRLGADDAQPGDLFGTAVAISGQYAFVGAASKDSSQGAVYVFKRGADGNWAQTVTLTARGGEQRDRFGTALAVRGDTLLVGAPGAGRSGGVYVFALDRGSDRWNELIRLQPFDAGDNRFGSALAMDGGNVWVGSPGADRFEGRVYQFSRDPQGGIADVDKLGDAELESGDQFASAVDIHGDRAVIGIPNDDFTAGTAVLLSRGPQGWTVDTRVWSEVKGLAAVSGGKVDCAKGKADQFDCSNVDLLSFLPVNEIGAGRGVVLNDLWGWTDPRTRHEYALVGRVDGTSFVDVTDPLKPRYLGSLPKTEVARPAIWRDIKVYKNYAFIVADGSGEHGMQVFDLTRLRDVKQAPVTFTEDAHYDRIHSAHNIVIDTASGYAYAVGASAGGETCGGALHMINIKDPLHPAFAGCFADPATGRTGTGYTHDAQCVVYHGPDKRYKGHEICLNSSETALGVADVTDKKNPVALAHAPYPNVGYAHQGWLTEDQKYFYMDDELDELQGSVDGTRTLIWDVSDLTDPVLAGEHISKNRATDHNLYIKGQFMYQSNYVSGLRILDISNPKAPVEVGYFDTVPVGDNAPGFGGSWSNYPFFRSGTIVVTSSSEGLFMLRKRQTFTP